MSEDLKKLESLSYRPVKSSPATLDFNSAVIRPETKVNKADNVGQALEQSICEKCVGCSKNGKNLIVVKCRCFKKK